MFFIQNHDKRTKGHNREIEMAPFCQDFEKIHLQQRVVKILIGLSEDVRAIIPLPAVSKILLCIHIVNDFHIIQLLIIVLNICFSWGRGELVINDCDWLMCIQYLTVNLILGGIFFITVPNMFTFLKSLFSQLCLIFLFCRIQVGKLRDSSVNY